jgi:hypothetical protein
VRTVLAVRLRTTGTLRVLRNSWDVGLVLEVIRDAAVLILQLTVALLYATSFFLVQVRYPATIAVMRTTVRRCD